MVFFSVGLSKNLTVATSKPVLFDKVFVDNRRAYHVTSGQFVAPVTGYYEFNYHALAKKGTLLNLRLYHNTVYVKHCIYSKVTIVTSINVNKTG